MPKRPATLDDQVWWIKAARSFAFSLTSTTSSRLIKTQKSRPIFSRVEASHLVNNYAMPYFFVPRPWNADYRINHNCNKSFNDDWLSTFLNSALIGLYAWCQSNWTVRAIAHAHLNDYFSLPAKKYYKFCSRSIRSVVIPEISCGILIIRTFFFLFHEFFRLMYIQTLSCY